MTVTRAHSAGLSIAPSSGSVPVTVYGMFCPNAKKSPSSGVAIVTVGAVLPTVMTVLAESDFPVESVTVSLAV